MVLGSVINWTVYRTLDLTVGTLWWVATNTSVGIYHAGRYLIGYNNTDQRTSKEFHKEKEDLLLLKEQNMLLKQQNELLRKQSELNSKTIKESPF